ncbi:NUDIX hydrolase [Lysinibacillus fusiformis ZB2]|nr:NUDIX hydrolase [Lysinibacillus fusiformis ZB2]
MTWKGFESLRGISVGIIAHHTDIEKTVIRDLFANETGYATPKIDIRALVFKDNKI